MTSTVPAHGSGPQQLPHSNGPDPDAVFEAAEDLLYAVDVTAAGSRLPEEIAGPVERPAEHLASVWAGQSGDRPLNDLTAAMTAVLDAVRPHEAHWPSTLATACAAADAALAQTPETAQTPATRAARRPVWTAAELMSATFPEPRWAVPGVIAEGLNVLAGAPKVGKSWLALDLAVSIALGRAVLGRINVEQGPVLYLALEDTARRLQSRMTKVLAGQAPPEGLTFMIESPPLFAGGEEVIGGWLEQHPAARLIIIDVFAKFRGYAPPGLTGYEADYRAMGRVKKLADQYGVALLAIFHTRKMKAEDVMEEVSGTNGVAGAADAILVLKRSRGDADGVLHVTGRDVDETEQAMRFNADQGAWQLLDGPAADLSLSATRASILTYLRERDGSTPKQISDGTGLDRERVKKTVQRMADDGQVDSDGKGRYFVPVPQLTIADGDQPTWGVAS